MSDRLVYAYSTSTFQKRGYFKVGMSTAETIRRRYSSLGKGASEKGSFWTIRELPNGYTDASVHYFLIRNGVDRDSTFGGREWFKCSVEDIEKAYNDLINSGMSKDEIYKEAHSFYGVRKERERRKNPEYKTEAIRKDRERHNKKMQNPEYKAEYNRKIREWRAAKMKDNEWRERKNKQNREYKKRLKTKKELC